MKAIFLLAFVVFIGSACVKRDEAVSRAMEWVNSRVPYDKNRDYNGYVMGCEGIVGYGWKFPKPGVPSWELIPKGYCKQISKSELANGDLLVCPNEHQLIFNGWANAEKSSYFGIEESGSVGSTRRSIPWPYFSGYNPGCYIPCRVTSACMSDESTSENLQI